MLEGRDEDLVAGPHHAAAVRLRDQVDGLGGPADEHDLPVLGGVEEAPDAAPRRLVGLSGALAEEMDAAVHVGVVRGVVPFERLDDGVRLLRRRGIVEIDERPAVDLLAQDGKVLPDALHVPPVRAHAASFPAGSGSAATRPPSRREAREASSRARSGSMSILLSTSLAKPKVSRARALVSSSPRLRR